LYRQVPWPVISLPVKRHQLNPSKHFVTNK
jgi:hypothetical protein